MLQRGSAVRAGQLDTARVTRKDGGRRLKNAERSILELQCRDDGVLDFDLVQLCARARVDARKVRVVEMRFFAGLTVEETAVVLKVSPVTVRRDWSSAKIWLYRELTGATDDGFGSLETAR